MVLLGPLEKLSGPFTYGSMYTEYAITAYVYGVYGSIWLPDIRFPTFPVALIHGTCLYKPL